MRFSVNLGLSKDLVESRMLLKTAILKLFEFGLLVESIVVFLVIDIVDGDEFVVLSFFSGVVLEAAMDDRVEQRKALVHEVRCRQLLHED